MKIPLNVIETVTYGDLYIRTIQDHCGKPTLKIQSDKRQLIVRPSAGNTVIIESTENSK